MMHLSPTVVIECSPLLLWFECSKSRYKIRYLHLLSEPCMSTPNDMLCGKILVFILHTHTTMFAPHFITIADLYITYYRNGVARLSYVCHAFLVVMVVSLIALVADLALLLRRHCGLSLLKWRCLRSLVRWSCLLTLLRWELICRLTNKTNARPASCRKHDLKLLERNKNVTLTRRSLLAAEVATLNCRSTTKNVILTMRLLRAATVVTLRLNEWSKSWQSGHLTNHNKQRLH